MVNIKLQIWDPPGEENENWGSFYVGADGVILVFDLSYPVTFYSEKFKRFIEKIQNYTSGEIILLGNKSDLTTLNESEINEEDINHLRARYNLSEFITTSAKTGENIDLAFKKLSERILEKKASKIERDENIVFKITLAGLPRVGKTCIIERFTKNTFSERSMTIGGALSTKEVQYEFEFAPRAVKKEQETRKAKKKVKASSRSEPLEILREEAEIEEKPGGGFPAPAPSESAVVLKEDIPEPKKTVERKATVFYKERMNPMKLNKMAVIISTEELYESLKIISRKVTRAATGLTLEIEEDIPTLEVKPIIPGCVCSPPIAKLDARKEYDHVLFLITPLEAGDIPDARVEIYYKDELIDAIPTPIKVVKTTVVKISTALTLAIPILGSLFDKALEGVLEAALPFYEVIGGLDGMLAILTGIFSVLTAIFYYFRKPKDATPVESQSLREIVSTVAEE